MKNPSKINVFGTLFSDTNISDVITMLNQYKYSNPAYVCFPSTNVVSKAYLNTKFQQILNDALLTIPDGKITEVYCRLKGHKNIKTTSGYNLLKSLLNSNLSHYFYGVDEATLELIRIRIEREFPLAKVLGYKSPPFLLVSEIANNEIISKDIAEINKLQPDLIWIGISNIKQDYLMHHFYRRLDHGVMLGVGAVFLYFSGNVKQGPGWLKKFGLKWIYRIIQEPRKEFRKTVPSTLFFLLLLFNEVLCAPFFFIKKFFKL